MHITNDLGTFFNSYMCFEGVPLGPDRYSVSSTKWQKWILKRLACSVLNDWMRKWDRATIWCAEAIRRIPILCIRSQIDKLYKSELASGKNRLNKPSRRKSSWWSRTALSEFRERYKIHKKWCSFFKNKNHACKLQRPRRPEINIFIWNQNKVQVFSVYWCQLCGNALWQKHRTQWRKEGRYK